MDNIGQYHWQKMLKYALRVRNNVIFQRNYEIEIKFQKWYLTSKGPRIFLKGKGAPTVDKDFRIFEIVENDTA